MKELHEELCSLGAHPLTPLVLGDDGSDQLVRNFVRWSNICIENLRKPVESCCGGQSESVCDCEQSKGADKSAKRSKSKAVKRSSAAAASSSSSACTAASAASASDASAVDVDMEEEEDRINSYYVTADMIDSDSEMPQTSSGCGGSSSIVDLEDIGGVDAKSSGVGRAMVTAMQEKALKKEGYRIIGTHSAVKMCRWTKNQLRGRGGCYKHSFYGITR